MAGRQSGTRGSRTPAGAALPLAAFLEVPEACRPVGYSRLIPQFDLKVVSLPRLSFLAPRGGRREHHESGRHVVVFPPAYAPGDTVAEHLEFALKHEGVNLEL